MWRAYFWIIMGLLVSLLTACGSGPGGIDFGSSSSSGGTTTPAAITISGIAATGAPIFNGFVTITDVNGKTATGNTDLNGNFNIDVSTLIAPPFLVQVRYVNQQGSTQILYSYAAGSGTQVVNVNPLTNAEVSIAAETAPIAFNSGIQTKISKNLPSVITSLDYYFSYSSKELNMLLDQSGALISNPITNPYKIGTGLDLFFDVVTLSVSGTTFTVSNACNQSTISSSFISYSSVRKMAANISATNIYAIPTKLTCQ